MPRRHIARPLGLILSGMLAVALTTLVPAAAQAHIAAPTGLTPHTTTSSGTPTFTWSRTADTTVYELHLSHGDDLPFLTTQTTNNRYVPTAPLADGVYTWQVRADTQAGNSEWTTAQFTVSSSGAPSPISPVGGTALPQPDQPPLLTWSSVTGAVGYQVQIDSTSAFVSASTFTTQGTSYAVTTPQAPGTYYWRVRVNRGNGYDSPWSDAASYAVSPLPDPAAGTDMSGGPMQDVSIDWQPVPGAVKYQLQIGKDVGFNTIVEDRDVYGTRFQPNLTYNNGTYYWRVRAIDAAGNRMPWSTSTPFTFERSWQQAPALQWPANQIATPVGDPLYFQWSPVPHATSYQLDIATDDSFSSPVTCFTAGTTYLMGSSPAAVNSCGDLPQGQTLYWRVRAIDAPVGVLGIYSSTSKFVYDSGAVSLESPAQNATVDVPTLSWDPTREANAYQVTVRNKDGQVAAQATTASTTWTPPTRLDTAENPYTWTVVSVDAAGGASPPQAGRQFNVSGNDPSLTGSPLTQLTGVDSTGIDFPSLTWVPVSGAAYYRITLQEDGSGAPDGNGTSYINGAKFAYPAATDTGTHYLSPDSYDWSVTAYDSDDNVLQSSPFAEFTVTSLNDAQGLRVSLDGNAARAGAGCANKLSNADPDQQICTDVPATPTLSWNPVPGAAGYMVYLANERSITNLVTGVATTTNTMWRPSTELPDNTAGGAYYWYVRPCKILTPAPVCNVDPSSTPNKANNAFHKQSLPVALQTPADGGTVSGAPANAPLFTWADYLATNQADKDLDGSGQAGSYQSARTYRIQISQTDTFSTTLDDREVDQPFYSPSDRTLPEGTLYWRVQATDANSNRLAWSDTHSFTNASPTVDLSASSDTASPVGGKTVSGATSFRWGAVSGAASYTIEVYANDTGGHVAGNLMFSRTTSEPAYTYEKYLPPSTNAYTWRVMWTDAAGQARGWSADGRFFVKSSTLALTAPATGTLQKANGVYLTWKSTPNASGYYLDVRDGDNLGVYGLQTAATAFAPWWLKDGSYRWRVSALDPNGGTLSMSAWRTFRVDATAPTVVRATPSSTGHPKSHLTVRFSERVTGVNAKTFRLHYYGKHASLKAKVKLSKDGQVATLIPRAKLKKGHGYSATLSTKIHDPSGNHMGAWAWSFSV